MELSEEQKEEAELIRKTSLGDRQSFQDLYDRISGILFSTIYRIVCDQQDAQDVLQDVFLQIWEKAKSYDPARGKPLTWALTLARNKAIDRIRSSQRRTRLKEAIEEEPNFHPAFEETEASGETDSREMSVLIRSAMGELPQEQRQAIEMAYFSGLSQSEIAETLHEPLGTVKARIRRGMLKLRKIITPRI